MAICAQGLQIIGIVVRVVTIYVVHVKLAGMYGNETALLAYRAFVAHIIAAVNGYVVALAVAPIT